MSINVVEASATPDDYIRVAATVTDERSSINKVYAFAHSTRLSNPDVNQILAFIQANPNAVVTMFNPNTGAITSPSTPPDPPFQVIGFIRKVITDYTAAPVTITDVDASNTYHVYIVTQNNLGYNQVWESTLPA